MKAIEARHLGKAFGERALFEDASFSFGEAGLYLFLGESGSGKSTLFEILCGIDADYEGSLRVLGRELKELSEEERAKLRLSSFGFLRQEFDLLTHETALRNVLFVAGSNDLRVKRKKALRILEKLGLRAKAKTLAYRLSGGEKARLALARALMAEPEILLCDEPTGALDEKSALSVRALLKEVSKRCLVLINTHDAPFFMEEADGAYRISEGRIQEVKPTKERKRSIWSDSFSKKSASYGPLFWARHAKALLASRPVRFAASSFFLFLGFFSLGVSLFVARNASSKMTSAFGSLVGEGDITMRPMGEGLPSVSNVYSAPREDVIELIEQTPEKDRLCCSYLAPFETLLPDANSLYVDLGTRRHDFEKMSIRSVNDFLPLSEIEGPCLPEMPKALEIDEIVLGLPAEEMVLLSKSLRTERSYEAVANALGENERSLVLEVENSAWGYYDRESLRVKGLCRSAVPTLYHTDSLWNESFLEKRMRFPSTDGSGFPTPWTLEKVYGIRDVQNEESFLKKTREKPFDRYLFERDGERFDRSHLAASTAFRAERYFVFLADRNGLSPSLLEQAASFSDFSSFSFLPEGVYRSFPESLGAGFMEPFLLGVDEEKVLALSESLASVDEEYAALLPDTPEGTVLGSCLRPRSSSLGFSGDLSGLYEGREPENLRETVLSQRLYEKLGNPSKVYVAGVRLVYAEEGRVFRHFSLCELRVVGVSEGEFDTIHQSPHWLQDFFRVHIGMNAASLESKEGILHLKDPKAGERALSSLERRFPECRFYNPSATIGKSLSSVFEYLGALLLILSAALVLASFYLVYVLSSLYVTENRGEGRALFLLGFDRKAIFQSYGYGILTLLSLSFFPAGISLFGTMFLFDRTLSELFSLPFHFEFDPFPHLAIFLSFLFAAGFSLLVTKHFSRHHPFSSREEGKQKIYKTSKRRNS